MYTDGTSDIKRYQIINIKLPIPDINTIPTQKEATTPPSRNKTKQRTVASSIHKCSAPANIFKPKTQQSQKNNVTLASLLLGLFCVHKELPQQGDPNYDEIKHLYPKEWRF